ncbi:MAG: hydroxyacylglutathione hydrolase, partial [Alphaproteobacteria bacterium]
NTHHHWDHTGGIAELKALFGVPVVGPARETEKSGLIDRRCSERDEFAFAGAQVRVMEVPGHTLDHIAFHFPDDDLLACGDTLFSLGCGRIFEGTPAMMWHSLDRLRHLPGTTRVCCAHEYTLANGRFALHVEPGNPALQRRMREVEDLRERDLPTLPSTIALERATNPFLRPESSEIRARLGLFDADDASVFARLRAMKDDFRG